MAQSNGQRGKPPPLWAQLIELESRTHTHQLAKAGVVREICDTEELSLGEFASRARDDFGLDGLGAKGSVARLLVWAELVEQAHTEGVFPVGNAPAERTLRPLFGKRVPADMRLELLAKAAVDGHVTAQAIRAVIDEHFPKPVKRRLGPGAARTRAAIPKVRDLIDTYGWHAVETALTKLFDDYNDRELHMTEIGPVASITRKRRPNKGDKK